MAKIGFGFFKVIEAQIQKIIFSLCDVGDGCAKVFFDRWFWIAVAGPVEFLPWKRLSIFHRDEVNSYGVFL